jgi:hypothetical protein
MMNTVCRHAEYFLRVFNENDDGSSLLEAIVAIGLTIMALTASAFILIGTEHVRASVFERGQLATIIDTISTDIRAGNTYDGGAHSQLMQGILPSTVSIQSGGKLGAVACSMQRIASGNDIILVSCRALDGAQVQRVVAIGLTVPAPGALLTPSPQ